MKKLLFILWLSCLSIGAYAQTATSYLFSAFSDPFVSIAGSGTLLPLVSDDDYTETGIPIGFTFNYCGVSYTDLSACSNGYISLSNSPVAEFANLDFLIDGPGWLMPFWDDNYGVFTGLAYYETTGLAPNRVFTFEWNTYESVDGIGDITFQIKLYEGSGIIDFHYGPSSLFFTTATIGISNDNISDWQTLSDAGSAPVTLLSPIFETFVSDAPADGQVYRWSPSCFLAPVGGLLTTCPAGSVTLTEDTTGGTWSSGDIGVATVDPVTGVVSGMTTGTAVISYTTVPGCFITAIVTVSVPTPITGTLAICQGLSTLLANGTPGGTWSSGSPAIADAGVTPGQINGFDVGTATISYTFPDGCVALADVTVNISPAGLAGSLAVCQGATTTLTNSVPGGTWSSSFTSIATIDAGTGEVTGVAGGVTTISYTMPGTGCYRIASLTVNPLPAPITGGSSICIAGTFSVGSTTFGGTWLSSDPGVATVDASSGLVTGVIAGTTTISYTLASSCYRTLVVTVTSVVADITGDGTVCRGETSSFSSATPGGTWSSSVVTTGTIDVLSGVFYGVAAGTTTVSYILGSGCFTTTIVTVNQLEPITGTASVCPGSTITMANAVPGGTWTSGDVSFYTVDASSGVVTGIAPGIADITYLNPLGCTATMPLTVNALPSVITGDMLICVGSTSLLSSTPTGGAWSHTPLGAVSVDAVTGVVTGASVGVSDVTYTISTGCRRVASVTVDAVPAAITGITVVCPGTTALLSHPVSGGTWSSSDAAIVSVASTGVITGEDLAGGTATISYTVPVSGCVATISVTVDPAPAPISGSLTVCVGNNTTLSTTSVGATWSSSVLAVGTVGASTGIVYGVAAGTTTIICYGANGCTRSVVVTVNAVPGAITGTATVCVNSTTALSASPLPLTGTWSSSDLAVGTINTSGVVTGLSSGTTRITYTNLAGCISTRLVTVNALPTVFTPATNTVCVGLTITLNSTPASGIWTSSDATNASVGASSGVVTGSTAGTANITYTIGTGCIRVRTITVNPLPAAIGGPTSVCPGTTITMTNASAPAGAWSSSVAAVGTIGATTGIVMGITGGTTTIAYTLGTGCLTSTVVTVMMAPVAAITPIGDTVLCPGDFVTLTSSAAVGATYNWYIGGVLMPTATSPTYITGVAGSYQVRVSVTAGCTTLSPSVNVTVVPATATITVPGGTTTTCSGTPIVLNANTGVGLTYQWELAGAGISGATASTFSALTAGIYTVRVTNSTGCWAVSTPVTVTVATAPANVVTASGPLTICNGSNVVLTAAAGTGYTYQWHNTAGPIPGATSMSYSATSAESYHAVVSNTAGCVTTTAVVIVVVNPLPNVAITPGGPLVFCSGGVVTLSAAPGFNYQWYKGGSAIASATGMNYIATTSGGYRVRVTNMTTGCTDMTHADSVVTVVSSPTSLPLTPAQFCWGGTALLSTSISGLAGAVSYQWQHNGVVIPGATASTYNATTSGAYNCTIAVPLSCTVLTSSVTVTEVPLPDPPITFNGTAFKTGNFYISYQWHKNLVPVPGATSFTTPATGDGNYKVAVTDTNGCQSISAVYVLNGWLGTGTADVVDINSTDVRIFPNPATETVFIEAAVNIRAIVSTVDGKVLLDKQNAKEISISSLADGMYLITLYDQNGMQLKVQKMIKRQ